MGRGPGERGAIGRWLQLRLEDRGEDVRLNPFGGTFVTIERDGPFRRHNKG